MHDHPLGVRLTVASIGVVVLLVPVALIAVLVVGNVGWLHNLDMAVTDALHTYSVGHSAWVRFLMIWSAVFDPWSWRVATFVLVIWLWRRGARSLAWWVVVTMTVGGLIGVLLKLAVGRHRPDLLDPVARATGFSFPSGHALNSALGAAVFLLVLLPPARRHTGRRIALWTAAVCVPLMTALSRVALGVHWTSDVVAGLLLGVAVTAATAAAYLARRPRHAPVATEGLVDDEAHPETPPATPSPGGIRHTGG